MERTEETLMQQPKANSPDLAELERRKRVAEAALFMSPQATSVQALSRILNAAFSETLETLESLSADYRNRSGSLEILREGGLFRMKVKSEYADAVSHLAVRSELSKAVIRTLGLVAVKQPVKQSFVVKIIGNKAYDYVKALAKEGFITAKKKGNTKILETTQKFREYFGTNEFKPKQATLA